MYQKVVKQIEQGKWSPLYVLYGTELYLLEEMLAHLKKFTLTDGDDDFNYAVFDLEQTPVETLIQEAETLPFMGEKRLIVGRNAWFLTGTRGQTEVEHQLSSLTAYTESPLDSSIVVLIVPHHKLDERKKLVKHLKKYGVVVNFAQLDQHALRTWISRKVSQHRVDIQPAAIQRLIEQVGNDLQLLSQECTKLATYVGGGGTITVEHVDAMIPRTLEEDVFKLVDYIGKMNIQAALSVFYDLVKKREEPIKILSLIARQFRIILQVNELNARGYSQKQIASTLGLHPYPVKIAAQQGKQFTDKALRTLLLEANKTDYAIKLGQKEKTLALEWYILSVNRWAGPRGATE